MSNLAEVLVKSVESPEYGFYENCFLVFRKGATNCVVIDPGFNAAGILEALEAQSLSPVAILCTHGHLDHVFGVVELKKKWPDCPVYIGRLDADKLTDPKGNMSESFGIPFCVPAADRLLDDGDVVEAAGLKFQVWFVPGHSAGHVAYVLDANDSELIFSGDVLFSGGIGRSDFYDGNGATLIRSIRERIFSAPESAIVYCGHGPSTTVGREKIYNPYV